MLPRKFTTGNYLLFFLLLLCFAAGDTRKEYPQDYFVSPVRHKILLSGTFGELRSNHFHSGIDIKSSRGRVGDPLLAVADGYVSRIKISAGGYGNGIYIKHPNGYTSVYGHMLDLREDLAAYVKENQYAAESFEQDLSPALGRFPVTQGEEIGRMGTSGYSFGPHLHFEIRDSDTERPVNPLLFGFPMEDTRPPRMHKLKVYHLSDRRETQREQSFNLIEKSNNVYGVRGDTLSIAAWRAGLALKVFDHHNGVSNWNGIYSLKMSIDGVPTYGFEMEDFSFMDTRYINAHLDYHEQKTDKSLYHRAYRLPGNQLDIYTETLEDGVVQLSAHRAKHIVMVAEDIVGNSATFDFWVKRSEVTPPASATYNYFLPENEQNIIDNGAIRLDAPPNTFYENVYLNYHSLRDESAGYYSNVHQIGELLTPVHRYFELGIRPTVTIPEELRSKCYVARCHKGKFSNHGGAWQGDYLTTSVRSLGDFAIRTDLTPPTITPVSFSRDRTKSSKISFKITDNIPTSGKARDLRYRGTIDGQWVLFEYDLKKDILIHRFDERTPRGSGTHTLRLEVTDDRENVAVYEREFVR